MRQDLIYTIMFGLCFLVLIGIAEYFYHRCKVEAEVTRKFVHASGGIITLWFPYLLVSHWSVLTLCTMFFAILYLSLSFNRLPSINGVTRKTKGSLLFPIAVYFCFLVFDQAGRDIKFYYIPIMILSLCDPLAALTGKKWPVGAFTICGHTKTLIGSTAFLISAFAICLFFMIDPNINLGMQTEIIFLSVLIAIITTGFEAVCCNGYDNLSIPVSSTLLLLLFENSLHPLLCSL